MFAGKKDRINILYLCIEFTACKLREKDNERVRERSWNFTEGERHRDMLYSRERKRERAYTTSGKEIAECIHCTQP